MKGIKPILRCCYGRNQRFYLQASYREGSYGKRNSEGGTGKKLDTNFPTDIPQINGLFAVYKPPSWTSNDVVSKIRGLFRTRLREIVGRKVDIKVGHGGTLDPLAEGVLVLGIGSGTKLLQGYLKGSKSYQTTVQLGTATDTYDSEGTVTETRDSSHVTEVLLQQSLSHFRGDIQQVPPMYSALRINGKRLYDLARKGIEVTREPRIVTVYRLDYLPHPIEKLPHSFCLGIECSGGFYVRTLIHDLAQQMNTVGHMKRLIRIQQGPFRLANCLALPDWNVEKIIEAINQSRPLLELSEANHT